MPRPVPAEAPPSSDPAESSGRLLNALLSSAGLSVRGDAAGTPPPAAAPKKRGRRRAPSRSR